MGVGGILAQALAGATGVIGRQAGDDIEAQRKADMLRQQADIAEQTEKRLLEMRQRMGRDQTMWETTGEGGAAKLDLARRTGEQANDIAIKGEVSKATSPELRAAKAQEAEDDLQRDIRRIQATAKPEAEKAAAISEARARAETRFRKADPTVAGKMADMEKALGRPLTEQERLAALGLAPKGRDPDTGYETVEQKEYDANGQEVRKTTRKEPIRPGQGGGKADPVDPYAVPKRDAAPATKPAAADKPQGKGMLQSLTDAVSGAMESGAQTGRAVEAVRAKVRAGQPLSAQEQAIAKQYNLTRG
jgi:hypothetical protein